MYRFQAAEIKVGKETDTTRIERIGTSRFASLVSVAVVPHASFSPLRCG